jgi:hypothetical protein
MDERHQALIDEYIPLAFVRRSEMMLLPTDALLFLDSLEALGVLVLGASAWFVYPNEPNQGSSHEEIGDCGVDTETLVSSEAIRESAAIIRNYILTGLPERTNRVSIATNDDSGSYILAKFSAMHSK